MSDIHSLGAEPLYTLYPITPTTPDEKAVLEPTWTSLSESEQRAFDDLIRSGALALPIPKIDFATFMSVVSNLAAEFSISSVNTKANDVTKKLVIEQQQIILDFLDRWIESEQKIEEIAQENRKRADIAYTDALIQAFQAFIQGGIPQGTGISALIATLTTNAIPATDATKNVAAISALPGFTVAPTSVAQEFATLATGLVMLGMAWAAPVAVTLSTASTGPQALEKNTSKAFALSIAALVTDPQLDSLLSTRIDEAIKNGFISKDLGSTILASFKTSLLIKAMIPLYHSVYGGVSKEEIQDLITKGSSDDEFLNTMAKLVREQLHTLSPKTADALIESCLSRFDKEAPHEEFLAPVHGFLSLWNPELYPNTLKNPL